MLGCGSRSCESRPKALRTSDKQTGYAPEEHDFDIPVDQLEAAVVDSVDGVFAFPLTLFVNDHPAARPN